MTTLREQAAIAAMQALIPSAEQCVSPSAMAASWAVCYADALLAELARTTSPVRPEPDSLPCTAAERELIEAALDGSWERINNAENAVLDERRAAKDALPRAGGDQ